MHPFQRDNAFLVRAEVRRREEETVTKNHKPTSSETEKIAFFPGFFILQLYLASKTRGFLFKSINDKNKNSQSLTINIHKYSSSEIEPSKRQ